MPKYYYHGWTRHEEDKLAEIMLNGYAERKKTIELFKIASDKLKRSRYACQNRWYDIKDRYVKESQAV